ncbi:hypothetical protein N7470_002973 [Penicillium chermesinum]|nr:hypothetical protein N7470_002973 [Penicillium chermesinum]
MDHVSTLCALSTVGIAPTGLALGQIDRKKSRLRQKTLPHIRPLSLDAITPDEVRPSTSRIGHPAAQKPHNENHDNQPSRGLPLRRASFSFGAARMRRRRQTMTTTPVQIRENEATASSVRRPSTSWLRRLSIVSFQTDSPAANSPVTPSFHGSESPILPGPPSHQRKPPNKLTKRPSSQRSNVSPLFANPPGSAAALRRPATSYQRSETSRVQFPLVTDFESRGAEGSESLAAMSKFQIHAQTEWEPYLFSRSSKSQSRHIVPDPNTLPVLVPAPSVITRTASMPNNSLSEPITPQVVAFRDPFQGSKDQITPLPVPIGRSAHKHSYSLNDGEPKRIVVNTVTASGAPLLGRPRWGSLKRVKGRTFSVPRSELSKPDTTSIDVPLSPPRNLQRPRRNITDPSIFRQPHALSPPNLSLAGFPSSSQVGPRSVSQDYSIGLQRNRPLTSDAVALSTWQHACRSENHPYSSLRRRPKRHSIAASDPPSTVIGSDDTRVFTSSDEYETDIMTDYWDSIRTREVGRGDLKGLRIETMFDQVGARLSNEEVTTLEDLLPHGSFASRLERDPSLFTGSLLPPIPVHIDDETSLFEGEAETHSMIDDLPADLERAPPAMSNREDDEFPEFPPDLPPKELKSQKMNIFDWSEQSRPDRDLSDSETRPRTVHGKQNGVDRGSRTACRKVPSTIHLRSQSVPVAREVATNDSRQSSGKFGTWGLGTKGVSEDWDSDFEFEDEDDATPSQETKSTEPEAGAAQRMAVPQAILERQASLRGQFGQVQELTLLVEELKRLRHQASVLDILSGPSPLSPGSPLSLTFSFDDSDEETLNGKRNSATSSQPAVQPHSQALKPFARDSPKSKSVLDILQPEQRPDATRLNTSRPQKLPFDTSSCEIWLFAQAW